MSLGQARERQFAERKKLEAGIDPMAERKAEAAKGEACARTGSKVSIVRVIEMYEFASKRSLNLLP